jgi:hypothetical protein
VSPPEGVPERCDRLRGERCRGGCRSARQGAHRVERWRCAEVDDLGLDLVLLLDEIVGDGTSEVCEECTGGGAAKVTLFGLDHARPLVARCHDFLVHPMAKLGPCDEWQLFAQKVDVAGEAVPTGCRH